MSTFIALILAGLFSILNMPLYAVTALSIHYIIMIISLYGLVRGSDERIKIEQVASKLKSSKSSKSFLIGTFVVVGVLLCWFAYFIISMVTWEPFYLGYILFGLYSAMVFGRVIVISNLVRE